MACPTPEAIPTQELPTAANSESGGATDAASALPTQPAASSSAPVALTAQPAAEIEPPCSDE